MSIMPAPLGDSSPIVSEPEPTQEERRLRWFELFLVLFVAFGSSVFGSIFLAIRGPLGLPPLAGLQSIAAIAREAGALLLLGYVLRRRGLRIRNIGFRWSLRDLGAGLLVAIVSLLVFVPGSFALRALHLALFKSAMVRAALPGHGSASWLAIPFILLNPFCEELIVRAYLMTEISELMGSRALAVCVSVLVQVSYHFYYGWWMAFSMGFQFLVFALYYAWKRRALPIIVAHGLFDIYALSRML